MYCKKCGRELRDDAEFCDGCGTKTDSKPNMLFSVIFFAVAFLILAIAIGLYFKTNKKIESLQLPSQTSELVVSQKKEDTISATVEEIVKEPAKQPNSFFEGEATLELPSFVTYSKERLTLGDYKEDKASGGYVQYFDAGSDIQIVQCIAEYKDMITKYDLTLTGTLSSAEDGWNYTAYLFIYNGTAEIETGTINFNDSGNCDICIVTAVNSEEAYIAAYVPDGVSFAESSEHMKNSY